MRSTIIATLAVELSNHLTAEQIDKLIEIPPSPDMGDFSFPCFSLAKQFRKSPAVIAEDLKKSISDNDTFENVTVVSGYLNFFVNKTQLTQIVLQRALSPLYGRKQEHQKVVVEFASPNTNKPLHLGHLRNIAIGESVARIMAFCGNDVVRASINNDRGVHICKSMLAYAREGHGATPESTGKKSDHFVGDYYVLFSKNAAADPSWNEQAQELLRKWERGDSETVTLWKKMNGWALSGFAETYRLLGITFDKEYFESTIYTFGKEIIAEGLGRGIFTTREDGAIVVDLTEEKLGEKVLLRPDGTSVYIVQDLYLAVLKDNEYHYDKSMYVVGNEQEYHFAVLKAILRRLGYPIAQKIHHLSYGMVELPEGKMKSREGTVVDADELIAETSRLAAAEIRARYELDDATIADRSLKITLAAIKYQLLRVDISKNMLFDPKKAISFEGDTGPYLLYSYARAASIIRKVKPSNHTITLTKLTEQEVALVKKINTFPSAVSYAFEKISPSVLANYAFELSQCFNDFYHHCPVIGSSEEPLRLQLVTAFRSVLKDCLYLLGITEIEEM